MLEAAGTTITLERSTSKEPLSDADVRELLGRAGRVVVARGRSHRDFPASRVELDQLKGPTGKYRAPMLLAGRTLLVGFSAEVLSELLAG